MNLLNAIVHHQTFGRGEITQQENDMVSVSFPKPYGKKKFLFPGAFHLHLVLEDETLISEMNEVLQQDHLQIAAEQDRAERSERIARFRATSVEKATVAKKTKKKK